MKNFRRMALVVSVAALVGYTAYSSQKSAPMSNLVKANIEALADGESSYEYPDGFPFSFECGVKIGEGFWGDKTCSVTVVTCQGGGSGCNSRPCPVHH